MRFRANHLKQFFGAELPAESITEAAIARYVSARRTATRNMALVGIPEKHIMQVTGHKTRHMIDRYNITVERDTHNTLKQTQAYLEQQRQSKHGQNADTHDKGEGEGK